MVLVGYSDSEGSDTESISKPKPSVQSSSSFSKSSFQKVVDRSNPHKIKVNLPTELEPHDDTIGQDAPPAKKARTGPGAFGGFNSFLPAPKKASNDAETRKTSSRGQIGKGLGKGQNLKTGPSPGFSREVVQESSMQQDDNATEELESHNELGEKEQTTRAGSSSLKEAKVEQFTSGPQLVGKPMMFKPLSVGRYKGRKSKKSTVSEHRTEQATSGSATVKATTEDVLQHSTAQTKSRAKVSLFSLDNGEGFEESTTTPITHERDFEQESELQNYDEDVGNSLTKSTFFKSSESLGMPIPESQAATAAPQSLADIASHLPPSARRQLLGRHATSSTPSVDSPKILTFSPATEYSYNESVRHTAEAANAQPHRPVRGIAPGRHTLQQLVNSAVNQQEALEEQFASQRRNRRETEGQYGW